MWWIYALTFFAGLILGAIIMALMAANRENIPHEIHVYSDNDGNIEIMSIPYGDMVTWHDAEEKKEKFKGFLKECEHDKSEL